MPPWYAKRSHFCLCPFQIQICVIGIVFSSNILSSSSCEHTVQRRKVALSWGTLRLVPVLHLLYFGDSPYTSVGGQCHLSVDCQHLARGEKLTKNVLPPPLCVVHQTLHPVSLITKLCATSLFPPLSISLSHTCSIRVIVTDSLLCHKRKGHFKFAYSNLYYMFLSAANVAILWSFQNSLIPP